MLVPLILSSSVSSVWYSKTINLLGGDIMEPGVIIIFWVVIAFLNIVLFFKVWEMTNNTKKIRMLLEEEYPDLFWNGYVYKERKKTKK